MLEMGGTVGEHLTTALDALADGDPGRAELAASNDYKVNTMEIDIDADCTAILARRQPAAGDLRLVLAVTRITTDLERIGDEAKKIARVVLRLTESEGPANNICESVIYLVDGKDIRHLGYEDLDAESGDDASG